MWAGGYGLLQAPGQGKVLAHGVTMQDHCNTLFCVLFPSCFGVPAQPETWAKSQKTLILRENTFPLVVFF